MKSRLLALGVAAGLAVVVALPGAARAIGSPSASPSTSPTPSAAAAGPLPVPSTTSAINGGNGRARKPRSPAPPGGATVAGPHMCKCTVDANGVVDNGSSFTHGSTVTVSQTTELNYQMVQVSWTGFTPTALLGSLGYSSTTVAYPVMVAECRGLHPATPKDCWGAENFGQNPTLGGPFNSVYNITNPDGTGSVDIDVYTSVQNQFLGCDQTHPCSLAVVPAEGGNSNGGQARLDCNNHSFDANSPDPVTSSGGNAFASEGFQGPGLGSDPTWKCSWRKRIVVPLFFGPGLSGCPLRNTDFTAGGSPMLAQAMLSWQEGLCHGGNSVEISYNGTINENEARDFFQTGGEDVAFTTLPLTGTASHPFTYAPVAVSATSVAFWVDNSATNQPYSAIKLTPRLLTKMLTTSYAYTNDQCFPNPSPGVACDRGVDNNPPGLFEDKDFLRYNPGTWNIGGGEWDTPTVVSGNSDMTWETTGWIASNQAASDFLAGIPDPWGMRLDSYYGHLQYPADQFVPADPYPPVSFAYAPLFPLSNVVLYQSNNQPPGTSSTLDNTTGNPTYDALQPEPVGQRDLFAIVDEGDAANFLFPVASLQNAAGKFVQPTDQAMAAAVKDMTVGQGGILSMNFKKKDPAAYPLTMVIYAVVPTGGIPAAKAAAIARFLDFVASQGQQQGKQPGDLASGYLPLPESLRQQTLKAASEVLNQTGNPKKPAAPPSKSPSSSPPTSTSPSKSASPSVSPTHSPTAAPSHTPTAHSIAISFSRPDATGMSWVVLALLVAGAVLLIAGPAALVTASPGARAAIGGGARRIRELGSRTGNHRRGASRLTWRRRS
jgi:hypothetical protein